MSKFAFSYNQNYVSQFSNTQDFKPKRDSKVADTLDKLFNTFEGEKRSGFTTIGSPSTTTSEDFNESNGFNRSSKQNDFRVKYKTEICKYWEVNKECKFGDSVRSIFNT
jgi:hypothetical protein